LWALPLLPVLLALAYGALLSRTVSDLEADWRATQVVDAEKRLALAELRHALGFGGLVTHYNQLLQVPSDDALQAVNADLSDAQAALDDYRAAGPTPYERGAIDALDDALDEYAANTGVIRNMLRMGHSLQVETGWAMVEAGAADGALTTLQAASDARQAHHQDHARAALRHVVASSRGLLPVFVLFAALQLAVAMRMRRTNRDLVQARDDADTALVAKSEFLATMSHEIRTPLNGVLGMAELLQGTALAPQQRRYADLLQRSGHNLLHLINDVLDLSKIDAGGLALEPRDFHLDTLLQDTNALWQGAAATTGVAWQVVRQPGLPDGLHGDVGRLRQVLNNGIGNALKFTNRGHVHVWVGPHPDGVGFWVDDTGPGIDPADEERLFQPFGQGAAGRRAGGSGLGLPISRRVVRRMGGRMGLVSKGAAGATFWVVVPLRPATGPVGPRPTGALPRGRPLRILLAEDNPVNQMVARGLLERMGHTVELADNGLDAVSAVSRGRFDVVLMDCQMPRMDGYEATQRIRALPEPKCGVPILALTANVLPADLQRCLDVGMDRALTKPIDANELAQALQTYARQDGLLNLVG
jgi:signal transduction histidine kinase/ActR/RegA family two-component response regulator